MVRDANLFIANHTTVFVGATAYSANTAALNLGMSGLPTTPSTMGVVHVSDPAAVRPITVNFEVSIDGGVNFRRIGSVFIPGNKKGQFSTNIGRDLKLPFAAAVDVRVRANIEAAANADVDNATMAIDLGVGERSDLQGP